MKYFAILAYLFSVSVFSSPLEKMKGRIENYQEIMAPDHCSAAKNGLDYAATDYGLMASVECEIQCENGAKFRERSSGSFLPHSYGLTPGDGSNTNNTLWRSVGVTMQTWSEEVCLEAAESSCKGIGKIKSSDVVAVESGEWKLDTKLGCKNQKLVFSPFDQTVKANRIPAPLVKGLELAEGSHKTSIFDQVFNLSRKSKQHECKHKMEADLCFGDCVHEMKNGEWKETFSTPEPLGTGKISWCMDDVVELIKNNKNLSSNIKIKICEAYFWSSMMYSHESGSSCAAIRGEHQCEKLVNSL